jgi:N-acetylglucosaminyldiphosphoundecaprenol N-acetyl-beta-D-mannosaminyltransferase
MPDVSPARVSLFGIELDRFTFDDFLNRLDGELSAGRRGYVVTPNVDHLVRLKKDSEFRQIYERARFVVPDGTPLLWAAGWLGKPLPERITGADLFPRLCRLAAERGYSVYFLGASPEICRRTEVKLQELYPQIKIAGSHSPYFGFERSVPELVRIVKRLKETAPDIVFVGLGAPKQEKLIHYLQNKVPVKLFLGVGAALEFFVGAKKRAPQWAQRSGLEWAFRFFSEPKRLWKRYLVDDPRFFWWVLKEKFSGRNDD